MLLNHWVQLALITPVMLYAGWPIHRTGWLALRHRTADMNTLITVGHDRRLRLQPGGHRLPRRCCPADVRDVYFEAVGVILTLILLGRLLEARAKAGTGEAIRRLIGLQAADRPRRPRRRARSRSPIEEVHARRRRGGPARREDPGRRRGRRGPLGGGRVDGHRRADAGDQEAGRPGDRRARSTRRARSASGRPRSGATRCSPRSSGWSSRRRAPRRRSSGWRTWSPATSCPR